MALVDKMTEKLDAFFKSLGDKLEEQVWYQDLRAKWAEVDPARQNLIKLSFMVLIVGGTLFGTISLWSSVWSLKSEYQEKQALLDFVQKAQSEVASLGASGQTLAPSEGELAPYVENLAISAGHGPLDFDLQKLMGESSFEAVQENMYTLALKKSNLRKIIKLAFEIENGSYPGKMRHLLIEASPPPEGPQGYLDAKLSFSFFSAKNDSKLDSSAKDAPDVKGRKSGNRPSDEADSSDD